LAFPALGHHSRVHPQRLASGIRLAANLQRLPWGSVPFNDISSGDRCTTVYLPVAIRSQRFPRSQRFDPARTLQPMFHAAAVPGIRVSSVFPARSAATPYSVRCPLAIAPATNVAFTWLRGFAPSWRPFLSAKFLHPRSGRYAPDLFPLRGLQTGTVSRSSPPRVLTPDTVTIQRSPVHRSPHFRVLVLSNRRVSWGLTREPIQPP
jgi:hypothetical protein